MGGCVNRPSTQEIQQHLLELNSKNDSHFTYYPLNNISVDSLQKDKNLNSLKSRLKLFTKKKEEYEAKLEMASLSSIPELNIEIQKAMNLEDSNFCFTQGSPFVVVSLDPFGPRLETFESNIYLPYWYRFIQFKQSIAYKKITFTVVVKKSFGENSDIGTLVFNISDLLDQQVKEGWFNLVSSNTNKPSLKVRIQYIHNEKNLIEDLIKFCDERIHLISENLSKIQ